MKDIQMEIYEMIQLGKRLDNQDKETNIKETFNAIKEEYPDINEKEIKDYITKKVEEIYEEDEYMVTEEELIEDLYGVYNNCEYTPSIEEDEEA